MRAFGSILYQFLHKYRNDDNNNKKKTRGPWAKSLT